jgi:hypothetical protein
MKPSVENVNRIGTLVSEKVHLDEIAATLDGRPWSGLMSLAATGLIACRSGMAPI